MASHIETGKLYRDRYWQDFIACVEKTDGDTIYYYYVNEPNEKKTCMLSLALYYWVSL